MEYVISKRPRICILNTLYNRDSIISNISEIMKKIIDINTNVINYNELVKTRNRLIVYYSFNEKDYIYKTYNTIFHNDTGYKIIKSLNNINIVKLYYYKVCSNNILNEQIHTCIMEYGGRDLLDLINEKNIDLCNYTITNQIISVILFLIDNKIYNPDFKLENLVYNINNKIVKLIDFEDFFYIKKLTPNILYNLPYTEHYACPLYIIYRQYYKDNRFIYLNIQLYQLWELFTTLYILYNEAYLFEVSKECNVPIHIYKINDYKNVNEYLEYIINILTNTKINNNELLNNMKTKFIKIFQNFKDNKITIVNNNVIEMIEYLKKYN
jgi:serine/threonine protein kinase